MPDRVRPVAEEGAGSKLRRALGKDWKGKLSVLFYIVGLVFAFCVPQISLGLYIVVALMWLVPDRRIEKNFKE